MQIEAVIPQKDEAKQIIEVLQLMIKEYGFATVADFYDLVGVTARFTDNHWGWRDISWVFIAKVNLGFQLELPTPIQINK